MIILNEYSSCVKVADDLYQVIEAIDGDYEPYYMTKDEVEKGFKVTLDWVTFFLLQKFLKNWKIFVILVKKNHIVSHFYNIVKN